LRGMMTDLAGLSVQYDTSRWNPLLASGWATLDILAETSSARTHPLMTEADCSQSGPAEIGRSLSMTLSPPSLVPLFTLACISHHFPGNGCANLLAFLAGKVLFERLSPMPELPKQVSASIVDWKARETGSGFLTAVGPRSSRSGHLCSTSQDVPKRTAIYRLDSPAPDVFTAFHCQPPRQTARYIFEQAGHR
jgi:hypothetical protein